jgi:hypothetical protein
MSRMETQDQWRLRSSDEFRSFFQSDLARGLDALEEQRKSIMSNLKVLCVVLGTLAVAAAAAVLAAGEPPFLFLVVFGLIIIGGIGHYVITHGFRDRFKTAIVTQMVRFFGPDFQYEPRGSVSRARFLESRIFDRRIDRYRGEDYISGTAGKTHFECSEVHAEYKTTTTDSKGRRQTHWHTIFKGLYFIADFNKHFQGITLVLPDYAESTLGWIGQKLQEWNFSRPGELVKLEDAEFEKLFVVYSTDQIESRYILSPSLMQRLVTFRRKFRHVVYLSFIGGSVHIAVNPGKNLFEPSIFKAVSYATCRELFEDMVLVLGIVDELNLNTRIWTKQ